MHLTVGLVAVDDIPCLAVSMLSLILIESTYEVTQRLVIYKCITPSLTKSAFTIEQVIRHTRLVQDERNISTFSARMLPAHLIMGRD